MNLIECKKIVKVYKSSGLEFEALHGLTFSIEEGEFVALVGPSGCGKSTLLNILGLLDSPTKGHYFLNDKDTSNLSDYEKTILRRQSIGFIFQSFNLISNISILNNVKVPMKYADVPFKEADIRAKDLLSKIGLLSKSKNTPLQISGGQRQRVCIARALANDPKIIIADEPTGNLDYASGQEVLKIFKDLNKKGYTIIMVTHDKEIAKSAGRIIKILDGNIVS